MNDHDLLIQVDSKVNTIKTLICNHLKHHFAVNIALLGGGISIILALIGAIITLLINE